MYILHAYTYIIYAHSVYIYNIYIHIIARDIPLITMGIAPWWTPIDACRGRLKCIYCPVALASRAPRDFPKDTSIVRAGIWCPAQTSHISLNHIYAYVTLW